MSEENNWTRTRRKIDCSLVVFEFPTLNKQLLLVFAIWIYLLDLLKILMIAEEAENVYYKRKINQLDCFQCYVNYLSTVS